MLPIQTFKVIPKLPEKIYKLHDLAYNLRWAWERETRELFRRLDRDLWEKTAHNPLSLLSLIDQKVLFEAVKDAAFMAHYNRVTANLEQYLQADRTWYQEKEDKEKEMKIAYFSPEFAITESFPIYSGGLGVLSGDHIKASSDLGLPMVAVGLLYQKGYFRQYLSLDGWQQEATPDNDFYTMAIQPVEAHGQPILKIEIPLGRRTIWAQIWKAQVGRIPLYLLNTNIPENNPTDRRITDQLYVGDREMRLQQEIILGIGGMRLLRALNIHPTVYHMNEGHTAFLAIERIKQIMESARLSFAEAKEAVSAGNILTTHTPVIAGNEYFSSSLVDSYFKEYYESLGLDRKSFLALGRENPERENEDFCMTILGIRLSAERNAVSKLHGKVSRRMWSSLWPGSPESEVPITYVTNAIHYESWVSYDLAELFESYLGPKWHEDSHGESTWAQIHQIPSEELWRTHERRRERLVAFARRRLSNQLEARGASEEEVTKAQEVLDPRALTIGFARRFATYKRATLLLKDLERFIRLLSNSENPIQFLFAGKAHPSDQAGKEMIRSLIQLTKREDLRRRIVFLEDYDLNVARYLVQGVDVWLNTPRRPMEASGTSGMKAAANGALTLSILDGWWDEAYNPNIGWAIGHGETYVDEEQQDQIESEVLYDILEKEVIPLYYDRGKDGLPRRWVNRMKVAMAALSPQFNTNRMLREYTDALYIPSHKQFIDLSEHNFSNARSFTQWKNHLIQHWNEVSINSVENVSSETIKVGDLLTVQASLTLGSLSPDDVSVELYLGKVNADGDIIEGKTIPMNSKEVRAHETLFQAVTDPCNASGLHGFTVRVLPKHAKMREPWEIGLVHWAHLNGRATVNA